MAKLSEDDAKKIMRRLTNCFWHEKNVGFILASIQNVLRNFTEQDKKEISDKTESEGIPPSADTAGGI